MTLFAEDGFWPNLPPLVTSCGGAVTLLIAAIISFFKYLDERRKRRAAEEKLSQVSDLLADIDDRTIDSRPRMEKTLAQVRELLAGREGSREGQETMTGKRYDEILAILRESAPSETSTDE
jgi:hypothetical protein